jgi:hypothetical protein
LRRRQLKNILTTSGILDNITKPLPEKYIYQYNSKFHYAMVSVADNEDIAKTTLGIQLSLVKRALERKNVKD